MDVLKKRAAWDLNCPSADVEVVKLSMGTFGVMGCGGRATYLSGCSAWSRASSCGFLMNGVERPSSTTASSGEEVSASEDSTPESEETEGVEETEEAEETAEVEPAEAITKAELLEQLQAPVLACTGDGGPIDVQLSIDENGALSGLRALGKATDEAKACVGALTVTDRLEASGKRRTLQNRFR